ncbi:hypothetical protein Ahy_B05g074076 [Arachis hypogaea]|uniref:Uncharacterized protein n=1 Tax=Arachis hypogaea TaxID=3818 RepID=A0A444YXY8_ARAHY|nr:hypothetical protein Ahy_B05g074076 [Arachis hypogaea]
MRNFYIGPGPLSQAHCDATLPCGVHHHLLLLLRHSDANGSIDDKCESRFYIGNLDLRITE